MSRKLKESLEDMSLEYYQQHEKSSLYGTETKMHTCNLELFHHWISATAKDTKWDEIPATVSTRIPYPTRSIWNWFRRRLHILVLDCDSLDEMYAAVRVLKRDNIGWVGIESSPDHFWIITDVVDTFKRIFPILEAMPGVDNSYIKATKTWKRLHLRAIPRQNSRPKFGKPADLRDQRVINWYNWFKELHNDPAIVEDLGLIQHLKQGTMAGAAADPDFDV